MAPIVALAGIAFAWLFVGYLVCFLAVKTGVIRESVLSPEDIVVWPVVLMVLVVYFLAQILPAYTPEPEIYEESNSWDF